jgi:hypothetical protein
MVTLGMSGSSDRCYYASLLPHGSSDRCYYASLLPQNNQRWYLVLAHEAYMYCIPPSGVNLPSPVPKWTKNIFPCARRQHVIDLGVVW